VAAVDKKSARTEPGKAPPCSCKGSRRRRTRAPPSLLPRGGEAGCQVGSAALRRWGAKEGSRAQTDRERCRSWGAPTSACPTALVVSAHQRLPHSFCGEHPPALAPQLGQRRALPRRAHGRGRQQQHALTSCPPVRHHPRAALLPPLRAQLLRLLAWLLLLLLLLLCLTHGLLPHDRLGGFTASVEGAPGLVHQGVGQAAHKVQVRELGYLCDWGTCRSQEPTIYNRLQAQPSACLCRCEAGVDTWLHACTG